MIELKLKQVRRLFFDKRPVIDAVSRAERQVLSRFGAFVRRGARTSIRRRRRISAPGSPPSSHTGLLKRFIFFGFDPARRSVVVGPIRLNQRDGTAPRLLEHGGTASRRRRGKHVRMAYRPRPYMRPALEKERDKLPRMWRDSVKR